MSGVKTWRGRNECVTVTLRVAVLIAPVSIGHRSRQLAAPLLGSRMADGPQGIGEERSRTQGCVRSQETDGRVWSQETEGRVRPRKRMDACGYRKATRRDKAPVEIEVNKNARTSVGRP